MILDQIRSGNIPEQAKHAVVKGLMPMEPEELLVALHLICKNAQEYLDAARITFNELPEGVKLHFFENREGDGDAFGFYLVHFEVVERALSALVLNPKTPAIAICDVAAKISADVLDLVVNNQVKILEEPNIINELRKNPALSINHKQKLDDYERLLVKDIVSPAAELEAKPIEEIEKEAIAEAAEFVNTFGKEKESKGKKKPEVEVKPANTDKISILEQISQMTVPQKIQAAIKGDREARGILIREANKLVCCAVIKSPKITDAEVEFYSNLRNVQTDVLRLISMNREWMRNYKIVLNLVRNPRTPVPISMKLLPRIHKNDLKQLMRDRGIPEVLRTMARRKVREG